MRKPEPLGTEFKNPVDGFQGDLVWKEIMEGKERMSKKEYSNLGGTTACVMRGVTATWTLSQTIKKKITLIGNDCTMATAGLDPSRPLRMSLQAISIALYSSRLHIQDRQRSGWKKP